MRSPVKWLDNEEYAVASIQEKALAWADHFAGKKVRETGINRGFWVEKFLASVGLGPGYAWCAAFSSYCIRQAGSSAGPGKGRAAVRNWASWSKASARTHVVPKRGDLVYTLNANGTGHIEFVTGVFKDGTIGTIGGNTNMANSREGDGVYKKRRTISDHMMFIRWWD